jgi:hypothetical protein
MTAGRSNIAVHRHALPPQLFRRLARPVEAVGTEFLVDGKSYTTTFWFPTRSEPTNLVEEAIVRLRSLIRLGGRCAGTEWWLGRLEPGKAIPMHFDRDLSLDRKTGRVVHPLWSSVLYLNRFDSAPTVILDQVLGPDGKSLVPPEPRSGKAVDAIPNHYVVFSGDLRHGVPAHLGRHAAPKPSGRTAKSRLRLTLLVNYWETRPSPPICRDYDGAIYPALQGRGPSRTAATSRPPRARER